MKQYWVILNELLFAYQGSFIRSPSVLGVCTFFLWIYIKIGLYRSSHRRCSVREGVLRNFTKFTGKHMCQSLFFLLKFQAPPATLFKKETLKQVFSCEFHEISKITFFTEHLWVTASVYSKPSANSKPWKNMKLLVL